MRRNLLVLFMVGVSVGALILGRATAQEGEDGDAAAEAAAWEALAKPGPEHADLMKVAGTWTVETKHWMKPDTEPMVSTGKAVFVPLLGGRFVRQEYDGTFMGQPFQGVGCSGFNNATGKYEDVWIDSMGTGMMIMSGTATEPGKVWTFHGSFAGPGGKEMKMRSVMRRVSDDEQRVEMFCADGDQEMKCMELLYKRVR